MIAVIEKSTLLAGKIIAAALFMALPATAAEKEYAVTVYGGYRGGGSFTDANTGQGLAHRMLDAVDRQPGSGLRGFDPVCDTVQGKSDTRQIRRCGNDGEARRAP